MCVCVCVGGGRGGGLQPHISPTHTRSHRIATHMHLAKTFSMWSGISFFLPPHPVPWRCSCRGGGGLLVHVCESGRRYEGGFLQFRSYALTTQTLGTTQRRHGHPCTHLAVSSGLHRLQLCLQFCYTTLERVPCVHCLRQDGRRPARDAWNKQLGIQDKP